MVGTERFELSTSCSRSKRSTRLSYVPSFHLPEGPEERSMDGKGWGRANKIYADFRTSRSGDFLAVRRRVPRVETSEYGAGSPASGPSRFRSAAPVGGDAAFA